MTKANLGSGEDYRDGWLNVDYNPEHNPDLLYDLEETPWDFLDTDQCEVVLMDNVFEHFNPDNRHNIIHEIKRVLEPGGEAIIRLPTKPGWDATHHTIPEYEFMHHPRYRKLWDDIEVNINGKVGPGNLMTDKMALLCTKYKVVWCISEVEIRVR